MSSEPQKRKSSELDANTGSGSTNNNATANPQSNNARGDSPKAKRVATQKVAPWTTLFRMVFAKSERFAETAFPGPVRQTLVDLLDTDKQLVAMALQGYDERHGVSDMQEPLKKFLSEVRKDKF